MKTEIPSIVYRYRPAATHEIAALREGEIWASCPTSFDDPWDCALSPLEIALPPDAMAEIAKLRVACFTTRDDNTRMWSHYADSHKGICIGYRTSGISLESWDLRMVTYTNDPIICPALSSYTGPDAFDLFSRLVTTKSRDWKDQEEWRYICWAAAKNTLDVDQEDLVSITFGLRCDAAFKKELLNSQVAFYGHVLFREVVIDPASMLPVIRDCDEQHGDPDGDVSFQS